MLKRKITSRLQEWKESANKKALCIVGARQVGKSTAVRAFARENYEVFVELDFLENPQTRRIFEEGAGTEQWLLGISALSEKQLVPGKTLVLLDEIQECPQARVAVKYLVQDGRYDYIETRSLLGVKISDIRSYPVGYEELVNMYPLDLEEFMWAMNVQPEVFVHLRTCYENHQPVAQAVHARMLELFRYYLVVGGMPEVVQNFVTKRSLPPVVRIQEQIVNLYRLDITKYARPADRVKIRNVFDSVPAQLNEKSPRFYLTKVYPNARMNLYESSLAWLIESQEILPSYGLEEPQLPLVLNKKNTLFRLFVSDTGLLCSMLGGQVQERILRHDPDVNLGALYENVFADQFAANGFSLYYYNSKKLGEIDFVLECGGQADLVEIKSGSGYLKHPALVKIMNQPSWKFGRKIVFCQSAGLWQDGIEYLPWYMVYLYRRPQVPDLAMDFNFESMAVPQTGDH